MLHHSIKQSQGETCADLVRKKLVKFGESPIKLKLSEIAFTLNNHLADLTIHLLNFFTPNAQRLSPPNFPVSYSVIIGKEISKLIDSYVATLL